MKRRSFIPWALAVAALAVCLAVMMPKRLPKEDIVTSPDESMLTVRPTEEPEQVRLEIGEWQVFEDGSLELKWTMTATDEEGLVFCGDAKPVFEEGVQPVGGDDFSLDADAVSPYYLQIGRDIRGDGNGTVIQRTGRSYWDEEGMPVALAIHFDVYRPTAELIESNALGTEFFENKPAWWVWGSTGYRTAEPIDWYDLTVGKTPFGSRLVEDKLSEFRQAHYGRMAATPEEALEFLQEEGALRTALLEGYDFAEHVKSFDFIVDLTARSGVGAEEIKE